MTTIPRSRRLTLAAALAIAAAANVAGLGAAQPAKPERLPRNAGGDAIAHRSARSPKPPRVLTRRDELRLREAADRRRRRCANQAKGMRS